MLAKRKSKTIAVILALFGTVMISGLHKFYLGQPIWGIIYILLSWTPIPKVASAIEAVWYLTQTENMFDYNFNSGYTESSLVNLSPSLNNNVDLLSNALRELDRLREDGLISEYEFEQKRRQFLDKI